MCTFVENKNMKFHSIILSLFMAFSLMACGQTQNESTSSDASGQELSYAPIVISVKEFKLKMENPEAQLIDVRTDGEVRQGMLPGAIQLDESNWNNFVKGAENLDPDKPVLIYCRSGARSNKAAKYLAKNGFKEVYDMSGGIIEWGRNNGEIVKP